LNTTIPTKTVPTAPILQSKPHKRYLIGNFELLYTANILILRQIKTQHPIVDSTPFVSLALPKQEAKPTSNNPPMINKIQFINYGLILKQRNESANRYLSPRFSNFQD
jgi:hypothetical protein